MTVRMPGGVAPRRRHRLTVATVFALLVALVAPGLAQVPVGLSLGATYVRAYGGEGVGPELGVTVRIPTRLLSAYPSVDVTAAGTHVRLAGPVGRLVDGEHRRLVIIAGRVRLEWPVTRRLRVHGAGVIGVVESAVRSSAVILAGLARPANRAGRTHGLAIGVEGGVGMEVIPGALLDLAVAVLKQRAYADDPTFMPQLRLGVRVAPSF